MANHIKTKAGIAVFAIALLFGTHLIATNFFHEVRIRPWRVLSWKDFEGFPTPFSRYDAAIHSFMQLEYDSAIKNYHAVAMQHNVNSWVKDTVNGNAADLLRHEQYHFNITEVHARKVNAYIKEEPGERASLYNWYLGIVEIDLNNMQKQYDEETRHGSNYGEQKRWEFKIDSMLTLDKGWVTDPFSGARAWFPQTPDSVKQSNEVRNRGYGLSRYAMNFRLWSLQIEESSYSDLANSFYRSFSKSHDIKSFIVDSTKGFEINIITADTFHYSNRYRLIYQPPYMYEIDVNYPAQNNDSVSFAKVAASFMASFSIVDTDSFWIKKARTIKSPVRVDKVLKSQHTDKVKGYCLILSKKSSMTGFYRGPIYEQDGSVLLAFDYLIHPDTLHKEDILMSGQNVYSFKPQREGQLFFIPADKVPAHNTSIKAGYILKEDSAKGCYTFYYETIKIPSKP